MMKNNAVLPIGVDNFASLVNFRNDEDHGYLFVDKTMLIKAFIGSGDVISLVTRPRRFGKSLNMSMLEHFFAKEVNSIPTKDLFKELKISNHPEVMKYQGQHPTLFITLKDAKGSTYEALFAAIKTSIQELYTKHRYLLKSDAIEERQKQLFNQFLTETASELDYKKSLHLLSHLLCITTGQKVIILLDEYDTPLHDAYVHGYYDRCVGFLSGLFGKTFKGNDYLEKAMITGILKVGQASLFSNLNNVAVYSIVKDRRYGAYFGFTPEETDDLLERAALPQQAHTLKEMYNGYAIGGYTLYNPFSIVSFAKEAALDPSDIEGAIRPYWVNTGGTHLITDLLRNNLLQVEEDLRKLLKGEPIQTFIDEEVKFTPLLKNDAIAFWSIMLLAGYLKPLGREKGKGMYYKHTLCIPNQEIQETFERIALEVSAIRMNALELIQSCEQLVLGKVAPFIDYIEGYLSVVASAHDTKGKYKEQFFHGFLLGVTACLADTHHIRSNRESGKGRYDMALIPKDTQQLGVIIELKVPEGTQTLREAAQKAKQQIMHKQYYTDMQALGIKDIVCVGVGFEGSELVVDHEG